MRSIYAVRALAAFGGLAVALAGCSSAGHPSGVRSRDPAPTSAAARAATTASAGEGARVQAMSGSTVPAPHPGNVHNVVPARTVATRPAVGLRQVAKATPAVSIRLVSIRSTRTVAQGPGEVAGAGLALRIRITNSGHSAADLGNVVVNLTDARKRPAIATTGGPARAFSGTLRPGHSATGRYLFTVPADERSPIHVSVAYAGAAPVVLFTGNAS